jgi:pimeloyl-ACP methyl ester carboxylesterase
MSIEDVAQPLTIDSVDVFVEGAGAETLVMLHGWPDTHRLWDMQVAHFKDHYICVRFTLPGFDLAKPERAVPVEEMVTLLRAIVDRVSPDQPVTLLLHDWGCVFGYEFAAKHPQRVARIVGVDVGDHNSAAFRRELTTSARLKIFGYQFWLALAWYVGGSLGTRMTRYMARKARCPVDPERIGWQMSYPYAMQWFGARGGFRGLARIAPHCPMLYVFGARKPFHFHSAQWARSLDRQPHCRALSFPTGHWVMVQQPEAFARCVAQWLEQTPTG